MFTKKDLFWSVKGQYPEAKIGQSLADYKDAVAKVLAAKFELSDDVLANNDKFKMFVRLFCEAISKLMKKFSKNYFNMVNSKAHTVFFNKEITVESLTVQPGPPRIANDMETQTRKNDFTAGLEVLMVSHQTQTPKAWIPHSWKRPSISAAKAATSNAATSNGEPPAKVPRLALTSNDPDSSGEPPAKAPRLVQIRQTQRDAKSVRKEAPSTDVC